AWWAKAAVEPWIPVDLAGSGEAPGGSVAVTEAYAGLRLPAADVYVGRVPLPLETARLTLPFTLTPHDEAGRRPGADGVRADVYLASGRLQLAAVQAGGRWTPVAGAGLGRGGHGARAVEGGRPCGRRGRERPGRINGGLRGVVGLHG